MASVAIDGKTAQPERWGDKRHNNKSDDDDQAFEAQPGMQDVRGFAPIQTQQPSLDFPMLSIAR
jgi:hypothetical protein